MKDEFLKVRIENKMLRKIKSQAKAEGLNISTWIRKLLVNFFEVQK